MIVQSCSHRVDCPWVGKEECDYGCPCYPPILFNPDPKPTKKPKKPTAIPPAIVEAVLIRDNFTCQYTGKQHPPDKHSLHVHHRAFKKMGRSDKIFNMLDNLATCDWEKHQDHGSLKHARILSEGDDNGKINELERRYR